MLFHKKMLFITSLILNILLILGILASVILNSKISSISRHSAILYQLCEEDYSKILADFDRQFPDNPQQAAEHKKAFAITTCLRNYRTGQPLDLQPLANQVDATQ